MRPQIDDTKFGWIEVEAKRYDHDIVIELDGSVRKRKKKLSKKVYGTSHRLSLQEAEDVYEAGAERLIVGSGQYGRAGLSNEAQGFFDDHGVTVSLMPTPEAMVAWNDLDEDQKAKTIGLFHVTC